MVDGDSPESLVHGGGLNRAHRRFKIAIFGAESGWTGLGGEK
jgi:hypothetical protein